jgi:hypothetical protein
MTIGDWIKSNIDYGRTLVSSGFEGARAQKTALDGAPVVSVLMRSVQSSWMPAAIGAYIGALGATLGNRRKPKYGLVAVSSVLGATIGFTTGMAWGTRRLTGNMARGARKNIDAVRDAHWLSKNPIDYA